MSLARQSPAPRAPAPRALAALACVGWGLAACAGVQPTGLETAVGTSAPAPVAGYDWFLHADEVEARLAYGLAESDDVPLVLACRQGSGRLELSATAPTGAPDEIHLESGGETERFPARAEPSELHEGMFLTAEAEADAPVFQRFRRVGWLAIWQADQRRALAPQPDSAGDIKRFFSACG